MQNVPPRRNHNSGCCHNHDCKCPYSGGNTCGSIAGHVDFNYTGKHDAGTESSNNQRPGTDATVDRTLIRRAIM